MTQAEAIDLVLQNTQPLKHPRGDRLPLFSWPAIDIPGETEEELESLIRKLDDRGIAVVSTWNHGKRDESLARALQVARIQTRLGLMVNINANPLLHQICDGSRETAHIDENGEPFFDTSFSKSVKLGCPFALKHRYTEITERVTWFADQYLDNDIQVDFVFADWEIDGPIEWNDAWDHSKRCSRCREHIPDVDDFTGFQKALRGIRSDIQRTCYADVMKTRFPDILVGNYAVYPHDGYRYWYDYFEKFVEGAPHKTDRRARYRKWAHEFQDTGFTFAMPVVYTWDPTFSWYSFSNSDYRWFYNMLLVASNSGAYTPSDVPIITFVHWNTVFISGEENPDVQQFSEAGYRELLWHMLMRGHDTFFLWTRTEQSGDEMRLLHEVYAESLQYREFLTKGRPVNFDVPKNEGAVVSAVQLGDRLLVRRTDFARVTSPVTLTVHHRTITVPKSDGVCQLLDLE
jgi:hypothetical protein